MKVFSSALCVISLNVMAQTTTSPQEIPARFGTRHHGNVYATGEALWLKPIQSLENDRTASLVPGSTTQENVHYDYFTHKFAPGFRVAFGYNTTYDQWDLSLIYTEFNYKHYNSFTKQALLPGPTLNENKGSFKTIYHYYLGDFDLGKTFRINSHLRLKPHAGLRALWLIQSFTRNYNMMVQPKVFEYSRFKGYLVGLQTGVNSIWDLTKTFSFYANLGIAALVNNQKFRSQATDPDTLFALIERSTCYATNLVTNIDVACGFRWDRNLQDDNYHIGFNLGYELHDYISINKSLSDLTDFALHGVSLGARFDF